MGAEGSRNLVPIVQAGFLLNTYICPHSYIQPGDCSVSGCRLCTADSEESFFRQQAARILKLEDVSSAAAITMKPGEVLWFAVVAARTFLPFPARVCVGVEVPCH